MISRPAIVPAVRLEQPQVRLPADSNGAPQAMQRRTLITIADKPAKRRAMFFCSISLTTLGGRVLILRPSDVVMPPASTVELESPPAAPADVVSVKKIEDFPLIIALPRSLRRPETATHMADCKMRADQGLILEKLPSFNKSPANPMAYAVKRCQYGAQGVVWSIDMLFCCYTGHPTLGHWCSDT